MNPNNPLKEYYIKGVEGFPSLLIRFADSAIAEIRFLHKMPLRRPKILLNDEEKTIINKLEKDILAYFRGVKTDFRKYKIQHGVGTPFQKKIWQRIKTIPYGQIRTYKWLAEKAGKSNASRAAGNACGKNPVPILVPCPRIVASSGSLGGFSGGVEIKRRLLRLEGVSK